MVHNFRFFFAVDAATGGLRWAYNQPRIDAISSAHTGRAILFVTADGSFKALDAGSGAVTYEGTLAGGDALAVSGATFDAEGFGPGTGGSQTDPNLVSTLASILWDPDRRFTDVRMFALEELTKMGGPDVARQLLRALDIGEAVPPPVLKKTMEVLVARQDRALLPVYMEALRVRPDYAEDRQPKRLDFFARAVTTLKAKEAIPLLVEHLRLPDTDLEAVGPIADAAIALQAKEALEPFQDFLLQYRADPAFVGDPAPLIAACNVLLKLGRAQAAVAPAVRGGSPHTIEPVVDPPAAVSGARRRRPPANRRAPAKASRAGEGRAGQSRDGYLAVRGTNTQGATESGDRDSRYCSKSRAGLQKRIMRSLSRRLPWLCLAALLLAGCDGKAKEEMTRRLNEANDKLVDCRKETNALKSEIASLKRQVAQAMANPTRIVLTDPEIINLVASIRGAVPTGGEERGALDPSVASKIVLQGAPALRQCYERALKKNQSLQFQSGVGLTLDITVAPQGTVEDVGVNPSIDPDMTTCIKSAAMRWKFPTFAGSAVTIEQKVTLTPNASPPPPGCATPQAPRPVRRRPGRTAAIRWRRRRR